MALTSESIQLGHWSKPCVITSPPDRVVLISRDLREVGAERFGDAVGHGKLLLDFVERNYNRVVTLGGNPLDVNQHGAWVYALKPKAPQPR